MDRHLNHLHHPVKKERKREREKERKKERKRERRKRTTYRCTTNEQEKVSQQQQQQQQQKTKALQKKINQQKKLDTNKERKKEEERRRRRKEAILPFPVLPFPVLPFFGPYIIIIIILFTHSFMKITNFHYKDFVLIRLICLRTCNQVRSHRKFCSSTAKLITNHIKR